MSVTALDIKFIYILFSLEKLGNIKLAEFEEVTQSVDSQVWTKSQLCDIACTAI